MCMPNQFYLIYNKFTGLTVGLYTATSPQLAYAKMCQWQALGDPDTGVKEPILAYDDVIISLVTTERC